jgi:hypothetical protein
VIRSVDELVSKAKYVRVIRLRRTWATYELVVQNRNSWLGHIADLIHLRTPLRTVQYPAEGSVR